MSKMVRRLAEQFQPENYRLHIKLNRENMTFSGVVTIRGKKVGRPSQRITFHQKGLKITAAKITRHDKKGETGLPVSRINRQASYDEVRLHSEQMIYPGSYTITMEFAGKITPDMNGIYPCPFKAPITREARRTHTSGEPGAGEQRTEAYSNTPKEQPQPATPQSAESANGVFGSAEKQNEAMRDAVLLATQFESHYARKAFPCIDEPAAKATFDLTLTTAKGETVLSNTPVKSQKNSGTSMVTEFETTPKMSTYLLAFVTGEMHKKSVKTKSGVEVNAWSTVSQPLNSLDFAVDVAKGCIEFFEDYFGTPYPLAKADHVGLPDFAVGAMENWGLITYRERLLVCYPGQTSQSVREAIATVIAHETAHMWFGDLTTMRWWNDLWLNESFANLMEYQAVDALFPEWKVWDTFISYEGLQAFRRDATPGVQAVKTEVNHPDEIGTIFDPSIVYAKGGRLLYMLKNYIGENAFRRGLSSYFKKHAYGNTTGDDLWAALSEASGQDIAAFMNPWLERSGFPLVSVTQRGKSVKIEQEHFLDNPEKANPERLWPLPLFANAGGVPASFNKRSVEATAKSSAPVLLNTGARGHYLVHYTSGEQKEAVADMVSRQELGEADRLMLLNSGSMLARAGYEPYGNVLTMLSAYAYETSEPVWDMMALVIGEARRFVDLDDKLEQPIKKLVRKLIAAEYQRLGWDAQPGESAADTKLRALIIGLGAYAEEPAIVKKAEELFKVYKSKPSTLAPELRAVVFGVAVKQKTPGAFEYLLQLHDQTNNSDLKADISAGLTATHSKAQAGKILGRLKDSKLVKAQDADRWLVYLLRNRHTGDTAWQWMEANWSWVEETYKEEATYDNWPRYAASVCNTKAQADRYKKFFAPKTSQLALKRNIEIGFEEVDIRVAWLARDLKSVKDFFGRNS